MSDSGSLTPEACATATASSVTFVIRSWVHGLRTTRPYFARPNAEIALYAQFMIIFTHKSPSMFCETLHGTRARRNSLATISDHALVASVSRCLGFFL